MVGFLNSVLIIINPIAGGGRARKMIPELQARLNKIPVNAIIRLTQAPEHAVQLAREAREENFDAVIAMGGDGTVNEVINGLGPGGPPFGIIPAGTGNDLARSLKIPLTPLASLDLLQKGVIRQIDLGQEKDRLFSIIAGLGFPAEVMRRTNDYKGVFRGPLAIAYNVVKTISLLQPIPLEMELDGQIYPRQASGVFILNTRFTGGGLLVAPEANPSDGFLDVVIMNNLSRPALLGLLPRVYRGGHRNHPQIEFFRARKIKIKTTSLYSKMFDGSIYGTSPLEVEIIPQDFQIICPKEVKEHD